VVRAGRPFVEIRRGLGEIRGIACGEPPDRAGRRRHDEATRQEFLDGVDAGDLLVGDRRRVVAPAG